ncbi:MAG: hypothetical protein GYB66_11460 [Chloroflexi bacterium]|nr:hypothetical protein [Chloroflexota bacterium]
MSKKKTKRRPNVSSQALERARRELYGGGTAPAVTAESDEDATDKSAKAHAISQKSPDKKPAPTYRVGSQKHVMSRDELAGEYGYVIADLRSMGILAALLFVAMIVVSLLIEQLI